MWQARPCGPRDHAKPTHAYTMAGFPTSAQLTTYRAAGPWSSTDPRGPAVQRRLRRGEVCRRHRPQRRRLAAADDLDRRRAPRHRAEETAVAVEHGPAATREPLRHRGDHARAARLRLLLRSLLQRHGLAVDHRVVAATGRAGVGHRRNARLPERGARPVHPAELLRGAGSTSRSGGTPRSTTTGPAAPTPSPPCRCHRRRCPTPRPSSTATGTTTSSLDGRPGR